MSQFKICRVVSGLIRESLRVPDGNQASTVRAIEMTLKAAGINQTNMFEYLVLEAISARNKTLKLCSMLDWTSVQDIPLFRELINLLPFREDDSWLRNGK